MSPIETILSKLNDLIPLAITIALTILALVGIRFFLNKRFSKSSDRQFRIQLIVLILSLVGLIIIILALPVSESTAIQLLSLLGLVLSATIALSATTFLGNIMAGFMLRAIKNFRPGDFIRVGEHFGRVSERGLFHIEIQTENRDLTTLPNLYVVTTPVKVIRSSGTLLTAEISLGYDVHRIEVERSLLSAAAEIKLEEPFVHILKLGDFSVTYRVAGLLTDIKGLISARSRLLENVLDCLHRDGIEIVSPNFMNQRILPESKRFVPEPPSIAIRVTETEDAPEKVVFDKADEAESLEKLTERKKELQEELDQLKSARQKATDEFEKESLAKKIEGIKVRMERLSEYIARYEDK